MEDGMEECHHVNYIESRSPSLSWDEYFMLQAILASFKSKDPSTKVGCLLVNQENHQIGMGYNGFVAGIDESSLPWGKDPSYGREHQKYGYVVHAEANALLHSSESLDGARCYVTLFPCNECAKLLASKKIGEVIYLSDKHKDREYCKISKRIFQLAGISMRQFSISRALLSHLQEHFLSFVQDGEAPL